MKLNEFLIKKLKKGLLENEIELKLAKEEYENQKFKKIPAIFIRCKEWNFTFDIGYLLSMILLLSMVCLLPTLLIYSFFPIGFMCALGSVSLFVFISFLLISPLPKNTEKTNRYIVLSDKNKEYKKEIENLKFEINYFNSKIKSLIKEEKELNEEDLDFFIQYFNQKDLNEFKEKGLLFTIQKVVEFNLLEKAKNIAKKYYN